MNKTRAETPAKSSPFLLTHTAPWRQEEISDLKQTVALLRTQQADVATLQRAEALMSGDYWSAAEEKRIHSISALVEESKARLEAADAHQTAAAAETVRDTLLLQLAAAHEACDARDRALAAARQRAEALSETAAALRVETAHLAAQLDATRALVADAIREKGRAARDAGRLAAVAAAQELELGVRDEQLRRALLAAQALQGVEADRDRYRALAAERAGLAQGILAQARPGPPAPQPPPRTRNLPRRPGPSPHPLPTPNPVFPSET